MPASGLRRAATSLADLLADERSRSAIALTMALITVLATAVAFLQQDASIRSNTANREAERIGLEAVGYDVGMIVESSTDYGVFRRWFEELERQAWANQQAEAERDTETRELYDALAAVDGELSEWSRGQSRLLQPPFFDEATFETDFAAYHAELVVGPQMRAKQEHDARLATGAAWGSRALTYVTILTILAAALFFLGLATTLRGTARPIFAFTGGAFAIVSLAWTVISALTPFAGVPQTAIDEVVSAYVEMAQYDSVRSDPIEPDRPRYEAALSHAEAALAADPTYPTAYLARAEARLFFADRMYFAEDGSTDEAVGLMERAVDDYHPYLEDEPEDYAAWWNLGWAQLLAGHHAESIASTDRALSFNPDHFALYHNRALAELRMGDEAAADADVETALRVFADADLDSDAAFFVQADFNMGRLVERWPEQAEAVERMQRRLREAQVSLEALDAPTPQSDAPEVEALRLTALQLSPEGELVEDNAVADGGSIAGAGHVGYRVSIRAPGARLAMSVSVRVWRDGVLDPGSSVDIPWAADPQTSQTLDIVSPYGRANFDLDPGRYELEIYIGGATRGSITWEVERAG
ncbi:MAG: tetratricopeptide repeat protein [Candidatus Limnocylindria bacterium]